MKALKRSRRGVTLVELIVSVSLFVVLIGGILALFVTTNRIYGSGSSAIEAKKLCNELYAKMENKLMRAEQITLKNAYFEGDYILAIDNKVIENGSNIVDYDNRAVGLRVGFSKISEHVLGIQLIVQTPHGKQVYIENKTIKLNNLEIKGNKICIESEGLHLYNGLEYN